MAGFAQKKSYPGSVEFLGWNAAWSDSEMENSIEYFQGKFPMLTDEERIVALSGKRWKTFCPIPQFRQSLSRRGAKDLECYSFRELEPCLDVRIVRDDSNCDRLNISCSRSEWAEKGGVSMIHDLLSFLEFDYGHFNATKYFNIDNWHRITASPTFGSPKFDKFTPWGPPSGNTLFPACRYETLLELWEYDRGIGASNPVDFVAKPVLVYPISILTNSHLGLSVLDGVDLQSWIFEQPHRGTLSKVNQVNYFWEVLPDQIETVTRELWGCQFFNACEHFEIGGWDAELQLPLLRHIKQLDRPKFPPSIN